MSVWGFTGADDLNDMVLTPHYQGYQIATHANGDAVIAARRRYDSSETRGEGVNTTD